MIEVEKASKELVRVEYPEHEAFIDQAYYQWKEWNKRFFENGLDNPLIILRPLLTAECVQNNDCPDEDSGTIAIVTDIKEEDLKVKLIEFGYDPSRDFPEEDPYKGLPPLYVLSENTLTGRNGLLRDGDVSEDVEGRFRYLFDKMLHEMVHHHIMRKHGPYDWMDKTDEEQELERQLDERDRVYERSWWWDLRRQHSKYFAAVSEEICHSLGLPPVKYYASMTDHENDPQHSHVFFISNVRFVHLCETGEDYYNGVALDERAFIR